MGLKYYGEDDYGNPLFGYVDDTAGTTWSPSQTDIGLLADIGYSPTEASDFLKGMEEVQAKEGAGVAGSAGGSWAAPSASWLNIAKQILPSNTAGQFKLATGLAGAIGGALTGSATPQKVGYQGSIPQYTAVRQAVQGTYDPNRRPGSSGQQYFSETKYVPKTDTAAIDAARAAVQDQADLMAAANASNPAKEKAMASGGLASSGLLDYFTHGGLDLGQYQQLMGSAGQGASSPPSASSAASAASAPDETTQVLQMLAQMRGGTPASQEPRPIDAPETTQGSTPAPTQTQGTTPEPKTLDTFPVARQPEPEVPQAKFADDELGLSKAAWKYIRDSQDTQKMAPDLGSWGVDKKDHINYGGWHPGPSDRRNVTHYSDIPNEVFEKYVASRAKHDFNAANELLNPYAHWNMTKEDEMRLQRPDEYWALYGPKEVQAAQGGLMGLARGRYLQGSTDGMADKLPASIDGREPAKLSHGEFVVPADVVSHLGNGNSDAGAKKLYSMMDKIRMARTGTKKQGKQINPDRYMPGGAVGYASGGGIKGYAGETGSLVAGSKPTTYESNLSNWAGPYVTDMLAKGQAAAAMPYQAYTGPLTAGQSDLQSAAFKGYNTLATPTGLTDAGTAAGNIGTKMGALSYSPTTLTTDTFGAQQAQAYMNPYLQASLNPQIEEARRQAQITNMQNQAKMTQAGAYGGGRQAILQAESDRNLAQNLANITGQGYNTAYTNAMAQFNQDQARQLQAKQASEAAKQFGATYGLQGLQGALQAAQTQGSLGAQQAQTNLANLAAQMQAGTAQRGIESEGIAADIKQFEESRDYPLKMAQYMASLLPNLPLATQGSQTTTTNAAQNAAGGAASTIALLQKLGLIKADTTTTS